METGPDLAALDGRKPVWSGPPVRRLKNRRSGCGSRGLAIPSEHGGRRRSAGPGWWPALPRKALPRPLPV